MSESLKISKITILKTLKFENQLNFAKIIAKKLSKNWKTAILGTIKIQKSVGKKSGQLLSRDRSTQNQISQTTDHKKLNQAHPKLGC